MKVLGVTLFVAAILMHLSFVEWHAELGDTNAYITAFFYAREQSGRAPPNTPGTYGAAGRYGHEYNVGLAGCCGLVIPVLMIGGGIALLVRAAEDQTKKEEEQKENESSQPKSSEGPPAGEAKPHPQS
jgi:H+/gluconate symporter-like permease